MSVGARSAGAPKGRQERRRRDIVYIRVAPYLNLFSFKTPHFNLKIIYKYRVSNNYKWGYFPWLSVGLTAVRELRKQIYRIANGYSFRPSPNRKSRILRVTDVWEKLDHRKVDCRRQSMVLPNHEIPYYWLYIFFIFFTS